MPTSRQLRLARLAKKKGLVKSKAVPKRTKALVSAPVRRNRGHVSTRKVIINASTVRHKGCRKCGKTLRFLKL